VPLLGQNRCFLDYLATGKLNPEQLTQVVAGISQGCQMAECALLGERRQKCLVLSGG